MSARRPAAPEGWQADRRHALALLQRQVDLASQRGDRHCEWAMLHAAMDVESRLREMASFVIAESTRMPFVHDRMPEAA